ncbi:MAG: efflux RND transporter permease subunit [Methylovulum miyakonense]|uniref:efflux RND transporter permease subunit n=1 Tax=Methylovulum miyakonense TaxID=645578 RepID=UPI003BB6BECA
MGERRFAARIREIAAAADPVSRTYRVKATLLDGLDSARLGMTATVWLPESTVATLSIPLSAVFTPQNTPEQPRAWLVDEAKNSVNLLLDQDKARAVGVSTASLSQTLQAHYTGLPIGQFRDDDKLIDIVWRAEQRLRSAADELPDIMVPAANGKSASLAQFVTFETVFEDGVRWRRDRFPAISVRADVIDGALAPDVAGEIIPQLQALQAQLPPGYFIETGVAKEDAWTAQKSILIWIPLVVIVTLVLLMIQLQNLSRTFPLVRRK